MHELQTIMIDDPITCLLVCHAAELAEVLFGVF